METIQPRAFTLPDRQRVHDEAVASALRARAEHVSAYNGLHESHGGRYVAADLYKETFAAFRDGSPEARRRYNTPIHNAATVLASAHLADLLKQPPDPHARSVILLTGSPGAGKTSTVMALGVFPPGHHAIYEGQLARAQTAADKVEQVLAGGFTPVVTVAHIEPEQALRNTLRRAAADGRGSSIGAMADIQAGLPASLAKVAEQHGSAVHFLIHDHRDWTNPRILAGAQSLEAIASVGDRDAIERRLRSELDRHWRDGGISVAVWREAHGAGPLGPEPGLAADGSDRQRTERPSAGEARSAADAFVHERRADAVRQHPQLRAPFEALDAVDRSATERGLSHKERHAVLAVTQDTLHASLVREREIQPGRSR